MSNLRGQINIEPDDITSSSSTRRNIEWSYENEEMLAEWGDIAQCYKWLNTETYKYYKNVNSYLTIPCIVCSTVSASASFGIPNVPIEYQYILPYFIGGITIGLGVITTVQQFYRFSELKEAHRILAVGWDKMARNIRIELSKSPMERTDARHFIKFTRIEFERLMENSEIIPDCIVEKFNTKVEKDEAKPVNSKLSKMALKKPDICDRIVSINKNRRLWFQYDLENERIVGASNSQPVDERIAGVNNSQTVDEGWGRRENQGFPTDDRNGMGEIGMGEIGMGENGYSDDTRESSMYYSSSPRKKSSRKKSRSSSHMDPNERIAGANNSKTVNKGWGRRGNLSFPTDDLIFRNEMKENDRIRRSEYVVDLRSLRYTKPPIEPSFNIDNVFVKEEVAKYSSCSDLERYNTNTDTNTNTPLDTTCTQLDTSTYISINTDVDTNNDIILHRLDSTQGIVPTSVIDSSNERIAGANSAGDDRIFRNGMTENVVIDIIDGYDSPI
jgi:hypothetical protein